MARQRRSAEEIITKLWEAEVGLHRMRPSDWHAGSWW